MHIAQRIDEVREQRWANPNESWGLVPTMGYLHEGHLSLVRRAGQDNDRVVVSIYVNPTQFAPNEDLDRYPRDLERDLALLEGEGVDLVFAPSDAMMYPTGFQTAIEVQHITRPLEGASRPTHFRGVTTVVAKLLNIVQPTHVYFGQKDAQQSVVVARMIGDLNVNVQMIVCPIIREADGLAMSSRNARLSPEARSQASMLYRALNAANEARQAGETGGDALREIMRVVIASASLARPDYVSVADPVTLEELQLVAGRALF